MCVWINNRATGVTQQTRCQKLKSVVGQVETFSFELAKQYEKDLNSALAKIAGLLKRDKTPHWGTMMRRESKHYIANIERISTDAHHVEQV